MWNSRDYGMLAAAAMATFGLTVGTFWPRLANAVDDKPAATSVVKVPTLTVGTVQVTAKMDDAHPHTVLLTAKNTSDQQASAKFKASASMTSPSSEMSRVGPMSRQVWTGEYAFDLKANESQTISVELPDKAFVEVPEMVVANVAPLNVVTQGNIIVQATDKAPAEIPTIKLSDLTPQQVQLLTRSRQIMRSVPGSSFLTLTDMGGKQGIRALNLPVTVVPATEKVDVNTAKTVAQAPQAKS